MKYLGTYQSSLTTWHLQELMKLLEAAIEQGEYAAGKTFDQAALEQLRQDGQNFGELPTASAGQRATPDSLNRPFDLLRVRFEALLREVAEFDARAAALLVLLEKDSALVDQLLFAAGLEYWVSKQPNVGASQDIKWDFGMGHGCVAGDIPLDDPDTQDEDGTNGVTYATRPPVATILTDQVRTGLVTPANVRAVPIKYLKWHVTSTGEVEELYGADWTKLSLLEAQPRMTYVGVPVVEADSPDQHPFVVTGQSLLGSTPIYVRVQFTPRRNQVTRRVTNGTAFGLSGYDVSTDDVVVMANGVAYEPVTHYTIAQNGVFTPVNLPTDQDVTIWFVEYFPSYQCSINQQDWSPVVMLDAARPYPDTETSFRPITFGMTADGTRTALPVTDELGNLTGLFIQLGERRPTYEWLLKISNAASPDTVGATATLEVEFARPTYLNAIRLAPFTTFPLVLRTIEIEGMTADTRQAVWTGSAVLNRTTVLRFARSLVRRVHLTFHQENYSLKDYALESPDALRREVMNSLQSALPYAARRAPAAVPTKKRGALYEFGLEYLEGEDWETTKGIFVSGPHRLTGCSEIIRVDADITGTVDLYLYYRAYNASRVKVDENLRGIKITPRQTIVFPFAEDLDRGLVAYTDVYLKFVHRTADAAVERFMIQVANV